MSYVPSRKRISFVMTNERVDRGRVSSRKPDDFDVLIAAFAPGGRAHLQGQAA